MLYRVLLPYATFGIIINGGRCVEAAPIGKWMIGKTLEYLTGWVRTKRGSLEPCNPSDTP